jgi:hypothetical protein
MKRLIDAILKFNDDRKVARKRRFDEELSELMMTATQNFKTPGR